MGAKELQITQKIPLVCTSNQWKLLFDKQCRHKLMSHSAGGVCVKEIKKKEKCIGWFLEALQEEQGISWLCRGYEALPLVCVWGEPWQGCHGWTSAETSFEQWLLTHPRGFPWAALRLSRDISEVPLHFCSSVRWEHFKLSQGRFSSPPNNVNYVSEMLKYLHNNRVFFSALKWATSTCSYWFLRYVVMCTRLRSHRDCKGCVRGHPSRQSYRAFQPLLAVLLFGSV